MSVIQAALKPTGQRTDKVTRALGEMEAGDREAVLAALKDPAFKHADIGAAIRAGGFKSVDDGAVRHYREKNGLIP